VPSWRVSLKVSLNSTKKKHFNVVKPGGKLRSGEKSLSLLMQYTAIKMSHDNKVLNTWESEHHVWSGATRNSTNKYKLSDPKFKWKKTSSTKLNIKNKAPSPALLGARASEPASERASEASDCVFDCPLCPPRDKSDWAEVTSVSSGSGKSDWASVSSDEDQSD